MFLDARLAELLGPKDAAGIVRRFWTFWLDALGRAEHERHEGFVFFVARLAGGLFVSGGKLEEVKDDLAGLPDNELPANGQAMDMFEARRAPPRANCRRRSRAAAVLPLTTGSGVRADHQRRRQGVPRQAELRRC